MKTIRLIFTALIAVATMGLVACSSDSEGPDTPKAERAEITISLTSDATKSRAGGISDAQDGKIDNYIAFAFLEDGALDDFIVSSSDAEKTMTGVTTAAKSVYVVANVVVDNFVEGTGENQKSKIKTLQGLKDYLESMIDGSNNILLERNKVWASGFTRDFTFAKEGNINKATATVKVYFAVSKVNFTVINGMENKEHADAYKPEAVVALNVISNSRLFENVMSGEYVPSDGDKVTLMPLASDRVYIAGLKDNSFVGAPSNVKEVEGLKDVVKAAEQLSTSKFHYYLPENDATEYTTIIAVVVKNPAGKRRYFPIHFKEDATSASPGSVYAGYQIIRNNHYDVELTLGGSAIDNPGTPDPTDVTAQLTLKVEVHGWNPTIEIKKKF